MHPAETADAADPYLNPAEKKIIQKRTSAHFFY
jgi:hypothetical protein